LNIYSARIKIQKRAVVWIRIKVFATGANRNASLINGFIMTKGLIYYAKGFFMREGEVKW